MTKKHISIAIILIVLMIVLSEINNSRTKQQLENIRYEAEERLKNSKEKLLKDHFSDDPTTDPKKDSTIHYLSCFLKQQHKNRGDLASTTDLVSTTRVTIDEGRKHISVDYLTEGTYTEKDNVILAEHSHEGDPFLANRGKAHVVVLRLDKISSSLSVGKYDQSEEDEVRPPSYERIYQCE
tara:strand:+ start:1451 stop:1993 length:543 start_codon:yes stop_codon:yes gene_type:complete